METSALPPITVLSPADADEFQKGARWARFLGVVGMVLAGLMLVMGIFFGSLMQWVLRMQAAALPPEMAGMPPSGLESMLGMMGVFYAVIFLACAVLYFVPSLFLYQHGSRMRTAFRSGFDALAFHSGVQALRKLFTFMGILTLIMLVLYGLFFIVGVLGVLAATMAH